MTDQLDAAPLVLDGTLTIRTIGPVRDALREALASQSDVTVDCSGAESVDLSLIQLLLAARRSAQQAGKPLRLAAPAQGALAAALQQAGIPADPFWSGEA